MSIDIPAIMFIREAHAFVAFTTISALKNPLLVFTPLMLSFSTSISLTSVYSYIFVPCSLAFLAKAVTARNGSAFPSVGFQEAAMTSSIFIEGLKLLI